MRRALLLLLVPLTLAACGGGGGGGGGGESVTVEFQELNGSGQSGTATLTAKGQQTSVSLELIDPTGGTGDPQPVHIHKGTCDDLDPNPAHPLPDLFDGYSADTVDVPLEELRTGDYAINVHKSAAQAKLYTSCADIE